MKAQRIAVGVAAALIAGSGPALADSSPARKPLRQMICADFLIADDAAKPEIVYWMATRRQSRGTTSAVVDVDATDNLVPGIIERCKETPRASLWPKVTVEATKLR